MLRSYVRSSSSIVHGRVNGLRSVPSSLPAARVAAPNSSSTTHRCSATRRLCTTHTSHLSPSHPISATSVSSPSIVRSPLSWSVGYESNGFRVEAKSAVKDFNLTVYQFRHLESDSLFFHIARADSDHAFSVAFRTPVTNSTGVAHILEHTVLCGSKRYPVRDPFFLLVRRSLKTFMNAMTAQDYTMYPFSTQNEKDYKNLLEVYLDACFFPLLNKLDFLQEGHRLEVVPSSAGVPLSAAENGSADSSNQLSSLQIKGVVYNEMKGAMSDTSQLFISKLQEELFPTNSNHWNSGGEPSVIPTLTHDELKAFHQQCYNLENAVFISYGDGIPPLDLVNERVIQPILKQRKEQKAPPSTRPPPYQQEARFTAPKTVHATCPPDPLIPDPTKQTKVSQAYLCKPLSDLSPAEREVENFGLQMLSSLLLDTPTAPMYQSLIDPNIGSGYAPATGYDSSTTESTFAFGLQGIAESDVDDVLQRIESTLQQVACDGFPEERIEASLHQIEISLKHVRSHFGIGLLMRVIPAWAQGLDPIQQLRVNDLIQQLRKRLAEGPYFQQLIRKHLLDNPHRVTLIMKPDVDYAKKEIEAEQAKLREREKTLTADEKTRLIEEAQQLIQAQNSKQDTKGCQLPSLSIADIPTQAEIINLEELKDPSSDSAPSSTSAASSSPYLSLPRFVSLPQPSNGVGYIRGLVSAKRLPLALRPYLPLYTSFLTELGTQQRDYRELAHVLDMTTGGISAELHIFGHLNDLNQHEEMILFKSLALERNIGRMTELIREVLYQPFFNHYERLHQLLLQTSASCASSLQDSGSSYATSDASQYLFASANANECYNGIKNVQHINTIVARLTQSKTPEEIEGVLRDVAEKLKQISTILLEDGLERIFIVGDEGSMAELKKNVTTLFEKPKSSSSSSSSSASSKLIDFPFQPTRTSQKSFYALPLQVNNVSMVLPTVPYTHPDAPRLDVMAKILSSVYVHREVREKGGAYGGHVSHSSDGILAFSSYRDPNTLRTLDAYRTAPGWLLGSDNFSSTDIEEALLSLFSTIDAPRPPAAKGLGQFLYGITNEQRQEYRERLLAVQKKDVLDVCQKYLTPKQLDAAHVTIVGDDTNVPEQISNGREWKVKSVDLGAAMSMSMEGEEGEFEEEEEQTRA